MARSRQLICRFVWAAMLTASCQGKVIEDSSADAGAGAGAGGTQSDTDGSAGLGGVSVGDGDGSADGSGGASGSAGSAASDGGSAGAGEAAGADGTADASGAAGAGGADIDDGGVTDSPVGAGGLRETGGSAGGAGSTSAGDCGVTPPFDAGPPGTILIDDDFQSGAAPSWVAAQTSTSGAASWSVVAEGGGNAVFAETGSLSSVIYVAVNGDVRWNDVSIEAKVRIVSVGGSSSSYFAGVCARFQDLGNFYCAALRTDGRLAIRARRDSTLMTLGNSVTVAPAVTFGVWMTIRLEVRGNTLNAYYNGSTTPDDSLTLSDCAIAAGGVALAVSNVTAEFDDVKVTVP